MMTQDWGSRATTQEDNSIVKLFIHGSVLQLLVLGIYVPAFLLMRDVNWYYNFEMILGFLLVGSIFIIFVLGWGNSLLAESLWGIRTEKDCSSFLGQGVLFLIMGAFFFPIYLTLPMLFLPIGFTWGDIILIPFFLVASIISGYLGRHIAPEFEGSQERREEFASVRDRHEKCPVCGRFFNTKSAEKSISGYIICPYCKSEAIRSRSQPDIEF
ncbi:MAG: membrane protein of unknown function [Candidatus Thorarchaeota archaeon]|nr:MAG: membrane protein of unknown function [Candidatus Thorarchaeota archaeon]